jgi:hypothetical protein
MRRRQKDDIVAVILSRSGGLRSRVNAHCVNCIYDEHIPGGWRQQVQACTVTACALWDSRTHSYRHKRLKGIDPVEPRQMGCKMMPNQVGIAE